MTETNVQKIHIPFNTDLNGRSWIDRNEEYISAIPNITEEEWMDFYDRIDYSLNEDVTSKFEKEISEVNQEGYESISACILLVIMCFLGGVCDPTSSSGGSGKRSEKVSREKVHCST